MPTHVFVRTLVHSERKPQLQLTQQHALPLRVVTLTQQQQSNVTRWWVPVTLDILVPKHRDVEVYGWSVCATVRCMVGRFVRAYLARVRQRHHQVPEPPLHEPVNALRRHGLGHGWMEATRGACELKSRARIQLRRGHRLSECSEPINTSIYAWYAHTPK